MARNYVDSTTFVRTFLEVHHEGGDIQAVADRLNMQKASATVKASQLRQSGIQLPKLSQSRKKLDLSALARMVSDYEASLSSGGLDLDGKENVTISDHLGSDVPNDDGDEDTNIPGRGLVNAAF